MNSPIPVVHDRRPIQKPVCAGCQGDDMLDIAFDFAFQPIVDIRSKTIVAHEALVRGPNGETAHSVLSQVNETNRYRFDQACRVKAVRAAAELGMQTLLSINFLPNAVYRPEACIQSTMKAARDYNFPIDRIIFEVTEGEKVDDRAHLLNIFESYRRLGFRTAIDDFGAGYAGLNLLSAFQPAIIKLDMDLVRDIDIRPTKQAIVHGTILTCNMLGSTVVAEGVETARERDYLAAAGVELMQGYLFSRPAFQALGIISPQAWK